MPIDFLINVFEENKDKIAIIWKNESYSYEWLLTRLKYWDKKLNDMHVNVGDVVALIGDFTPDCITMLLSLINRSSIIVPLNSTSKMDYTEKLNISQTEKVVSVDEINEISFEQLNIKANHPFYTELRSINAPGLVLYTSGTSGSPKGAVHNFLKLLNKFKTHRKALKTVNFLMFDHWGGLNTMFHTISNGGTVLGTKDRSPDSICAFIEKHKIELLPASPTFLNLLIISGAYLRYDLSSLQLITYGTEPMPEFILKKLKNKFPTVKLQQTYGLIELGVLRSKSKSDDSLWVKVGGEGFETRVVDEILQIKADSAMLGYLNASSPFTNDGWFITGDQVEIDGEYIKILGRKSELINVGGEKVYPQEVENIILEMDNIKDVTVYGEKNAITGNIVCARVTLKQPEDKKNLASRLKKHCIGKMKGYMIPVKILIVEEMQYNERFKKIRNN
ncbi:MAG: fatty acid--CoA ligase family protein [Bacteroidetes bacterium]|nr:fatty acid--CoA ligase family protein [Bacteroidota bacterium]